MLDKGFYLVCYLHCCEAVWFVGHLIDMTLKYLSIVLLLFILQKTCFAKFQCGNHVGIVKKERLKDLSIPWFHGLSFWGPGGLGSPGSPGIREVKIG